MMSLLIPGPESPGKDFDVFMEPLVEELLQLWTGVPTYDALSPEENSSPAMVSGKKAAVPNIADLAPYSLWVPYNLPPWACMDQSNFMMSLLIPGPDSPGKDFDLTSSHQHLST